MAKTTSIKARKNINQKSEAALFAASKTQKSAADHLIDEMYNKAISEKNQDLDQAQKEQQEGKQPEALVTIDNAELYTAETQTIENFLADAAEDTYVASAAQKTVPLWQVALGAIGIGGAAYALLHDHDNPAALDDCHMFDNTVFGAFAASADRLSAAQATTTSDITIFFANGFDLSLADADTLSSADIDALLNPNFAYDVSGDVSTIDAAGVQVNLVQGEDTNIDVNLGAWGIDAGGNDNQTLFLGNLGVVGHDLSSNVNVDISMDDVYAEDQGEATVGIYNAYVDIQTSGDIDFDMQLVAEADDFGSASILIEHLDINLDAGDGNVNVTATHTTTTTTFFASNVYLSANASANALAEIKICDINISAQGADATFSFLSIDAFAEDFATANVEIHNITMNSIANNSNDADAYAGIGYITAEANDEANATIQIGSISIYAEANNTGAETTSRASAEAVLESISVDAWNGGVARVDIGSIDLHAVSVGGDAYAELSDSVSLDAAADGLAELNIGTINILAEGRNAAATMESFTLNAGEQGTVRLAIDELNFTAIASDGAAYASISSGIQISAYDEGLAEFSIGSIHLEANADGEGNDASADIEDIRLDGEDHSVINATIDSITILADGQNDATAEIENHITVRVEESANASLLIDSLDISAVASSGDARAILANTGDDYDFGIQVVNDNNANHGASAALTINQINLHADAGNVAYAQMSQFTVNADDGMATMNIGDVVISAIAENSAYAGFIDHFGSDLNGRDSNYNYVSDGGDDAYDRNISAVGNNNAEVLLAIDSLDISAIGSNAEAELYDIQVTARSDAAVEINIGELNIKANASLVDAEAYADQISAYADGDANATIDIASINITADAASDAYAHLWSVEAMAYSSGDANIYIDEINITARADDTANAQLNNLEMFAFDSGVVNFDVGQIQIKAISAGGEARAEFDMRALAYSTSSSNDGIINGNIDSISLSASGTSYAYVNMGNIDLDAADNANINVDIGEVVLKSFSENGSANIHAAGFSATAASDSFAQLIVGDINLEASGDSAEIVVDGITASAYNEADYALARVQIEDISLKATAGGVSADALVELTRVTANASEDATATVDIGSITIEADAADGGAFANLSEINAYVSQDYNSDANVSIGNINIIASGNNAYAGITEIYANAADNDITIDSDNESHIRIGDITVSASADSSAAHAFIGRSGYSDEGIYAFAYGQTNAVIDIEDINLNATAFNTADARAEMAIISASVYQGADSNIAAITIQDINLNAVAESGDASVVVEQIVARANNYIDYTNDDYTYDFSPAGPVNNVTYTLPYIIDGDYEDYAYATVDVGNVSLHAEGENASISLDVLAIAGHQIDDLQPYIFEEGYFDNLGVESSAYAYATVHLGDINLTALGADADALANVNFSARVADQGLDTGTDVWNGDANIYMGTVDVTANTASLDFALDNPLDSSYLSIQNVHLNLLGTESDSYLFIGGEDNGYWEDLIGTNNIDVGHVIAHVENEGAYLAIDINNVGWDSDRALILSGDGDIDVDIDDHNDYTMVFGHVDLSEFTGAVHFDYLGSSGNLLDLDSTANIEEIDFTSIVGFNLDNDASITFDGLDIVAGNFADAGSADDLADLKAILNTALNGTDKYAFALFDEDLASYDLNQDGQETTLGVLAYDFDGSGITSLVYFVNNLDNLGLEVIV